jgi:hypothetical protein
MRWLCVLAIVLPLAQQPAESPKDKGTAEANRAESTASTKNTGRNQTQSARPAPTPAQTPVATESQRNSATANDHTQTSSQQASDEDRATQRKLTWFTGILAGVGVLQLVVMFLTWWIYRRQAHEMRRQRHEMRRQRHVMYRQWKAMRAQLGQMESAGKQTDQLIETMRDTAMRELRAYVCMSEAMIEFRQERAPEVQVHIKNCGKTPAYDVEMWIGVALGQYPGPLTLPPPPEGFRKSKSLLAPGEKPHAIVFRHSVIPEDQMPIFGTSELTMFVYGEITYRDAFGKQRITRYRLMYGGIEPMRLRDKGGGIAAGFLKPDTIGNEAN